MRLGAGDLEVRVGEPERSWWRREAGAAEQWLSANGYTHRLEAWGRPLSPRPSAESCVRGLDGALEHALGVEGVARLTRKLVQPGIAGDAPRPDAPHADHLAAAFEAVVATGATATWNAAARPALWHGWKSLRTRRSSVQDPKKEFDEDELGRFELSRSGALDAARELSARLRVVFGISDQDPAVHLAAQRVKWRKRGTSQQRVRRRQSAAPLLSRPSLRHCLARQPGSRPHEPPLPPVPTAQR